MEIIIVTLVIKGSVKLTEKHHLLTIMLDRDVYAKIAFSDIVAAGA